MGRTINRFFWVPNFVTTLNLVSGTLAVFFGADGQLGWAAVFIFAAAVFDFCDGFAARLFHAYSDIGKELDSLADLVSFGLAPATIVFAMLELTLFGVNRPIFEIEATPGQWIVLFTSLLIPVAGAFRLAKFNTDTRQSESFLGLPIPANAIFFASLALIVEIGAKQNIISFILNKYSILTTVFACSFLMVSELPMFSMKFKNLKIKDNTIRFVFLGGIAILLVVLNIYALPLIIVWYVLLSLISRFLVR
ncbi:MAG: CDP-alcohol phosphatidyltransferase family protein [Prolixibacteraceae bacterium]|jgi:CDP-diacylglycerol--serine O-phosphatidyltransferase|nr:CDP-alcohol phosphatidyltransferase family protein [Prolixibacteraceae bacterium]